MSVYNLHECPEKQLKTTASLPCYIHRSMFVFVLHPLLFLYKKGRARALISGCETNQGDFTIWIYFLPSNLIEEISPNTEGLSENTSAWKR